MSLQIRGDGSQIRQRKTGAPANSQRNDFVDRKSSVRGGTNPTHMGSTSLPEGTDDVTSLKRAAVETLAIRLRFRHPRLRFLQNGISERKAWNHLAILPESDESSKVALFARLPKVAPGEIIFLWSSEK